MTYNNEVIRAVKTQNIFDTHCTKSLQIARKKMLSMGDVITIFVESTYARNPFFWAQHLNKSKRVSKPEGEIGFFSSSLAKFQPLGTR